MTIVPLDRFADGNETVAAFSGELDVENHARHFDDSRVAHALGTGEGRIATGVGVGEFRSSFRMACNRDELRSRPIAWPPTIREFAGVRAVMPIDLASGGTWIAVSTAGVSMTLLNVNPVSTTRLLLDRKSRGVIIPELIRRRSVEEAAEIAKSFDPTMFPPFRLLMVDECRIAECYSDGLSLTVRCTERPRMPVMFTSSGLGDHMVDGPRRALFGQFFLPDADWSAAQRTFHRHSWPDQRHLSVCMSRPDARTVSHTVINVGPGRVQLDYYPDAPDVGVSPVSLSLPRD